MKVSETIKNMKKFIITMAVLTMLILIGCKSTQTNSDWFYEQNNSNQQHHIPKPNF